MTAFSKIFRRDKLKTNESRSEENNNNENDNDNNKPDKTIDHSDNNNTASSRHSFQNEIVAPLKSITKGLLFVKNSLFIFPSITKF